MASKTLSWEPATGTFEVRYKRKNTATWTNYVGNPVSAPPIIITGLVENATYEWQVRSDCGDGDYSPWVSGPDFYVPYACRVPVSLHASISSTKVLTVIWGDQLIPIPLVPDPEVKIYAQKNDSSSLIELTQAPLPHYSDGHWSRDLTGILDPGSYRILFETQCTDGSRPKKYSQSGDIVIPANTCNVVPPSSVTFVPQAAPNNSYFEWPDVTGALSYDVTIYIKEGSTYVMLTSFNTNNPNTQNWRPEAITIDPVDLEVTSMGMGCRYTDTTAYPNDAFNEKFRVQYKPGGVLTNFPQGVQIVIRFYGLPPNQQNDLIFETLPITAPADTNTLDFCVPPFNPYISPSGWNYTGYAYAAPAGFVAGNTYKIRIQSRCQYSVSEYTEFEYYYALMGCPIVVEDTPIPPQDFSATHISSNQTVQVSFRIDRPVVDPYPNNSTWIEQVIAHYVPGAACIPSQDRTMYTMDGGTVTFKSNGDIVFTYGWIYPSQGAFYFSRTYQL